MRILLSLAVGLALSTFSLAASAYGDGATGYTGKQGASCTSCHGGAAAKPTVTITGPDSLAAGQTADYAMVVTTNLAKAAGGIAATDGATFTAGAGLQEGGGELSHTTAVNVAGGKATFTFKVTAPATGTTLKLFAVGMGSNGAGTGGDGVSQITKDITLTGGAAVPPPEPTTPGTPAPSQAGTEAADTAPGSATTSKTTTPPKKKKKPAVEEEEEEDEDDSRTDPYAGRGGCSTTTRVPGGGGAPVAAAMVLFALGLFRRRSQAKQGS